jgi:hypothetical protein
MIIVASCDVYIGITASSKKKEYAVKDFGFSLEIPCDL